jgi:SAM-dependent methyltransferase
LQRLLVPLDPWRFYELGRIAEERFDGLQLDVSSPKLLTSLLAHERQGRWVGVDLFSREIESWRAVDPTLDLRVEDARALSFADASFDGVICVSVIEHVPDGGDADVMAELWRVLKPGGVLHLTTNVSAAGTEVYLGRAPYGEASSRVGEMVFFERHYSADQLGERLLGRQWTEITREYVRMADPRPHDRFAGLAPFSYPLGFALRWRCAGNFVAIGDPAELGPAEQGIVYLALRKPA